MTRRVPLAFALVLSACGSLGEGGEFSDQVLNGGAGPFRIATADETGVTSAPPGSLFPTTPDSIGRVHAEPSVAIYDVATRLAVPPARDPALLAFEVDRAQWSPRRIARSTDHVIGGDGAPALGFRPGPDLLVPTEAFEVDGIFDPAIVRWTDGSVRLYYATSQGLGVASASSIDGTFTRLLTTPLLPDVAGHGPAQSPTLVALPAGGFVLYVGAGGSIFAATTVDGLAFDLVDADASTPAIDPIPLPVPADLPIANTDGGGPATQTGIYAPTAAATRSHTGRFDVRLYFETRWSDGTSAIHVAGSFDGFVFERSAIIGYRKSNPTSPSVLLLDDEITRLTFGVPRTNGGLVTSASVLASTPADRMLPLP